MFGNATSGLLVWGEGSHLKITIGRADLWDHRGGMPWTARQNYKDIRRCLEANDKEGLKGLFACETEKDPSLPSRPSVLPVGRLDILLPGASQLKSGMLNLKDGIGRIEYLRNGIMRSFIIRISMLRQEFCVELPPCEDLKVQTVTAWSQLEGYFKKVGFKSPEILKSKKLAGWLQTLPNDPAICVGFRRDGDVLWILTERDSDPKRLKARAGQILDDAIKSGISKIDTENRAWWGKYWEDVPRIEVPNPKIDKIYSYGLYKFACFTNPSGVPASLQGPWIEDHSLPPWSSDYHFNINVQMCYWPAYKANRCSHLLPLFNMVLSWRDKLRRNAKLFIGVDDGYMLPHAVDDRCVCMGSFWTGTIDHGCTAWIAQMMFSYCQYTGDMEFLKNDVYDFMKGAMRVYEAMLEKSAGKYVLPVSVSPEYRGAEMDAWGANASFQLAAAHRLCEDLIAASRLLGKRPHPIWNEILERLPKACLIGEKGNERIALWEGVELEESHRHHSHLAGICPFDVLDYSDKSWTVILSNTMAQWMHRGMGLWSGWCMPWASMIHSRFHNGRMSELILELWERIFTNEGHGTLHDVDFLGLSMMGFGGMTPSPIEGAPPLFIEPPRNGIMQMDAGMGAVTAVQDMMLLSARGVIHICPGVPSNWSKASFENMPSEGGAFFSASIKGGSVERVSIRASRKLEVKLANPCPGSKVILRFSCGRPKSSSEGILEIKLPAEGSCEIIKDA
ncbi:MAG: hypothetical protein A2X49_06565 [Lentisphaerae bacterium GWF2_52_8]|nr:MAG: hypothetical protein A2X49_06565 [Lentisphaerae bacterium GWF2_52_8]